LNARNARNGYILSSNYETENEFGRGKRKKIKRQFTDEDFFSTMKNKKRVKNILSSDDSDFEGESSAKQ